MARMAFGKSSEHRDQSVQIRAYLWLTTWLSVTNQMISRLVGWYRDRAEIE